MNKMPMVMYHMTIASRGQVWTCTARGN